jgi:hypothetical protein
VTDSDFHAEMIGSFFAFFARRSARGAITWGIRTWQEFVENGQVYSLAVASVPSRHARESSWRSGLSRAGRVLSTSARPQADTGQVDRLLSRVCQAVGQPPVTCW